MNKRPFFFRVKEDTPRYRKGTAITIYAHTLNEARHKLIADVPGIPVEYLYAGDGDAL